MSLPAIATSRIDDSPWSELVLLASVPVRLAPPTKPFSLCSTGADVDSGLAGLLARRENFVLSHEETLPVSLSLADFEVEGPLTVVSVVAAGIGGTTLVATGVSCFAVVEGSVTTESRSVVVAGAAAVSASTTGEAIVFDVSLTSCSVLDLVFFVGSPSIGAANTRLAISSAVPLR